MSVPAEQLWSEVLNDPLTIGSRHKLFTLSHHLQLFARMQQAIDQKQGTIHYQSLLNPDEYAAYAEGMQSRREYVHAIADCRRIIKDLNANELNLTAAELDQLKVYLNQRVLDAAPYYTQMGNLNLLAGDQHAWTRTCNATSLSMGFEALGITPEDFPLEGQARLKRIADTLEMWRYQNNTGSVGAQCYTDIKSMRMPDFLQFVAVYLSCPASVDSLTGDAYLQKVKEARTRAAKSITSYEMLIKICDLFKVKHKGPLGIATYGEKAVPLEKDVQHYKDQMEKLKKHPPESAAAKALVQAMKASNEPGTGDPVQDVNAWADRLEPNFEKAKQQQVEASPEYQEAMKNEAQAQANLKNLQNEYSQERLDEGARKYQKDIERLIVPELNKGNQIFLHKPGHYMKLHVLRQGGIDSVGLVVDDPWSPGKKSELTWRQGYMQGYFDSYMVLSN